MNNSPSLGSRREFIKTTGHFTAAAALAGIALPQVHAAASDTISIALIGCGGRGTGAASDALSTKSGPVKLVAMADVFEQKLASSYQNLKSKHTDQVEVSEDRKFIGFEGYRKAMDCLKPGDVAVFATPPAFRWVHYTYAIEKRLNVFMEKPITVDAPTTKKMLALAEQAEKLNLKAGVGLMVRHCRARQALLERIKGGEIGDITLLRACRMGRGGGQTGPKPVSMSELLFQIQRFHSFMWASGGVFSDYNIHQIDECCWMKGSWPVKAQGLGARHYRGNTVDQNFDIYSIQYIFEDGTRLLFDGRCMPGCHDEFASYADGTKGCAIISTSSHTPGRCRTFRGHNITRADMLWAFPQPEKSPYQLEWDDLMAAIRQDQKYNEVSRGAIASLVTSMGRMAAHTGQMITYEDMLNCPHEFAPGADKFTMESAAPLQAGKDGKYPMPEPGIKRDREF